MSTSIKKSLEQQLSSRSQAYRALAAYILANLKDLPFENSAQVAHKLQISESTVGRFCRALGYKHFKDLKHELKDDLGDSPWLIGDRLRVFQAEGDANPLANSLQLEIAALVRVYEYTRTESWRVVTSRLAQSRQVFVAGFGTERGIACSMAHMLQYLRTGVHLVDGASGHFGEVLLAPSADSMLIVYEARRHSRQSLLLCQAARKRGIAVTLITDNFCEWAEQNANEVFRVSTEFDLLWDSTATMLSLTHLLINAMSKQLGPEMEGHLNAIAQLHQAFVGYTQR
ncbi:MULTISPECIES: MurR/RpiR family transcriptional regulator [unclassified Pseudomonas]|uniref:MurR/RpiR family transcriptional regulator n=1 Tax=unclassified Pseudomonas TaxID=196821 RepID=UPI001E3495A0|nr:MULTISPECIES: MurR/RpiR family transcriptional regulator [unclassified Pseudomonas]MEB0107572.1 MurR/RpiR family transcriptional regulator [Pseudomonas sp. MH9.3]WPX77146.1 MurR/RpiR family transcriptional regulator [Pseudomonas sp. MH9.3]